MKIVFVILHYQNIEVTEKCISLLKKLNKIEYASIVIVDNASPNNSGVELKEKYSTDYNLHFIINKENSGFAKGNNLGYAYARDELGADVIVVMNNDIYIFQEHFLETLYSIKLNDTAIIAPDIENLSGKKQNPFRKKELTDKELGNIYIYNMFLKYIYRIPKINELYFKLLNKYKKNKEKFTYKKDDSEVQMNNFVPHGSCIIFLPTWISSEDFAFYPGTFMYFEEDILHYYANFNKYKIKYLPELYVVHEEDASINASLENEINKREFIAKNMVNSIKVLKRLKNKKY